MTLAHVDALCVLQDISAFHFLSRTKILWLNMTHESTCQMAEQKHRRDLRHACFLTQSVFLRTASPWTKNVQRLLPGVADHHSAVEIQLQERKILVMFREVLFGIQCVLILKDMKVVSGWGVASSTRQLVTGQGKMASNCTRSCSGWVLGKSFSLKKWQSIGTASGGSGGVTILRSVQKKWDVALHNFI